MGAKAGSRVRSQSCLLSAMGSAIWPPRLESWIGCAICGQRERPSSRVGVGLKQSTQENCLKARRPLFCKRMSRVATPLRATIRSLRTLPLRSLSVRWSAIRCLCWNRNSAGANKEYVMNFEQKLYPELRTALAAMPSLGNLTADVARARVAIGGYDTDV